MQDTSNVAKPQVESNDIAPVHPVGAKSPGSYFKKKRFLIPLGIVGLCSTGIFAYPIVEELLSYVDTENAYVTGHVHMVSPRITGTVEQILVEDNQQVQTGDVLAILDSRDEVIQVRKAEAHLRKLKHDVAVSGNIISFASSNEAAARKTAEATLVTAASSIDREQEVVRETESGIAVARQLLTQREAELRKAELDLNRYEVLEKAGAIATENLETAKRNHDVAVAARHGAIDALAQAKSRHKQAQAQVIVTKAQSVAANASSFQAKAAKAQVSVNSKQKVSSEDAVQEAQLDLENARLQLSYTRITSPIDGRIGRKTVELGHRVQPGTPLLAVVSNNKWIVANFKETQLRDMRAGQQVKITIDVFGNHTFSGRVDSFSPASGGAFALLPPDNATGNFTKIVQRIPVKITLDEAGLGRYKDRLTPGMSCVVKVKVH